MEHERAMQDRSASSSGFSVRLEGASLFDLVQFECLDRERKILRVAAAGKTGFLYFREGNLVHASTVDAVGESAVRAMLGWERGQVSHAEGQWPAHESITSSWQSVLLRIAHAEDEDERTDNVVTFPSRESAVVSAQEASMQEPSRDGDETGVHVVRITSSGDVRAAACDREMAESLAYVIELGDLVGETLALGRTTAMEVWTSDANLVAVRDGRSLELRAAWGGKDLDTVALRERLARDT